MTFINNTRVIVAVCQHKKKSYKDLKTKMDDITRHYIDKKVEQFIASIDRDAVCELASSHHPSKKPCRIFDAEKKGAFNICFPVEFLEDSLGVHTTGERWMVRIPVLPRLAFPEEKLRGEIATMKFISEKTTIPIPCLHGYSIGNDNILGLPFLLLDFIDGKMLVTVNIPTLPYNDQCLLFANLSDIYLQLFQHQFNHIGALTLDSTDENWVFEQNRPLSILMNDQTLGGYNPCLLIPPNQVFHSTIDYILMIHHALLDDFHLRRGSVFSESDACSYLYDLYNSRQFLMEWVQPKYNHGPFVLMHGDLRSSNILVDDDLDIVSILDWEWSHTIPLQMFVPPSWLSGHEVIGILKEYN
ncbi:hypothetical protein LOZ51_003675 [Ophidiomyces ophidiicola]|nr:hypothetical protein LOZ54_001943 [Ophidiomyces ophidiicola]KAI1994485.1 hypothetical protein LOZ51_003675 [Ophidiomyces ophidiicola]